MGNPFFHCGHCGSLFRSEPGHTESRECAVCHQKPGTGIWPGEAGQPALKADRIGGFGKSAEITDDGGKRAVRKKRGKNLALRFVVAWIFVLGTVIAVRHFLTKADQEKEIGKQGEENMAEGTMADERVAIMASALPQCHQALAGFLTAGTPEARNQFVADPINTAARMAAFYGSNPFPRVDLKAVSRIGQQPLKVGGEWMIETRWQEGEDGACFDAVFRRGPGGWMLDWDHFARYCDKPWSLFLAGEGSEEAEFRLLARKVSGGDAAGQAGSGLRFELLAPVFGRPLESGAVSPEMVVARRSDEGLLLEAAFNAKEEGKPLFGSLMETMEPEGLVRVRVRVKRGEFGGVRSFDVSKVVACHWMSSDEAGFDLEDLRDDLFRGN